MWEPLPKSLLAARTYLCALLSSRDAKHWMKLKGNIDSTHIFDLPIASRWRQILEEDWALLPDTPSPLTLDKATLHHSIRSAALTQARTPIEGARGPPPNIILRFPSSRQRRCDKRKADLKRKAQITREPLRGSDANGANACINVVLERCPPTHGQT